MPRALSVALRQEIAGRSAAGELPGPIAAALRLSPRTVRHLLARFGSPATPEALAPAYSRCGPPRACHSALFQACVRLRRAHPDWGAGRICVALAKECPGTKAPNERLVRRWLAQAGLAPQPAVRWPAPDDRRATEPHHVWQMDASEEIRLGNDQRVCWLRGFDECSGAILWTAVFPPRPLVPGGRRRNAGRAAPAVRLLGTAGEVARR